MTTTAPLSERTPEPLEALESTYPSVEAIEAWDAYKRALREAYAVERELERKHGLLTPDYDTYMIDQEADNEYYRRMGEV